jgi:hypothetical protein
MTLHLVTFAHGSTYQRSQIFLNRTYKNIANIDTHTQWNLDLLSKTDFYNKNLDLFNYKVGTGLWCWKPFIILEKLKQINFGDFVIYLDSSKYDNLGFKFSVLPVINFMNHKNINLLPGPMINVKNYELITPQCLNAMNANNNITKFHNHYHTSPLFIRKTPDTVKFVEEWLFWVQNKSCIIKLSPYHQCDQAIFNILLIKYNFKSIFPNFSKDNSKMFNLFLQLFHLHSFDDPILNLI